MRNFYIIILAVAVIGGGVLFYSMRGGGPGAMEPVDLGDLAQAELLDLAQPGGVYGDPDAGVTIMEFGDYRCNACRQFALFVKPQVDLAYIQDGQAKFVFHDFPVLGPPSFLAARAARCAGDQDRYFDYHDQIFDSYDDWASLENPAGHFNDLAGELGLDTGEFRDCLGSDRHADAVTANLRLGEAMGVTATPTLFVHRGVPPLHKLGGAGMLDIQQAIEGEGEN